MNSKNQKKRNRRAGIKVNTLHFFISIVAMLLFSSPVIAQITTLNEVNQLNYFDFEQAVFVQEGIADISYYGIADLEEGYTAPFLYVESELGGIVRKDAVKNCASLTNEQYIVKEVEIAKGKEYCLRTRDGLKVVDLRVIELAQDWSEVRIEWEKVEERRVPFTITNAVLKRIAFIVFDIVLLLLIVLVIRYIFNKKHVSQIQTTAYCFKCTRNVHIKLPRSVDLENGAQAIKGYCERCSQKVSKIVAKHDDTRVRAFCLHCQKKVPIHAPKYVEYVNGIQAWEGACSTCENKVSTIAGRLEDQRVKAYCLHCTKKRGVENPMVVSLDHGTDLVMGSCSHCKMDVSVIVGRHTQDSNQCFCLSCKQNVEVYYPRKVWLHSGSIGVEGKCAQCKGKVEWSLLNTLKKKNQRTQKDEIEKREHLGLRNARDTKVHTKNVNKTRVVSSTLKDVHKKKKVTPVRKKVRQKLFSTTSLSKNSTVIQNPRTTKRGSKKVKKPVLLRKKVLTRSNVPTTLIRHVTHTTKHTRKPLLTPKKTRTKPISKTMKHKKSATKKGTTKK